MEQGKLARASDSYRLPAKKHELQSGDSIPLTPEARREAGRAFWSRKGWRYRAT